MSARRWIAFGTLGVLAFSSPHAWAKKTNDVKAAGYDLKNEKPPPDDPADDLMGQSSTVGYGLKLIEAWQIEEAEEFAKQLQKTNPEDPGTKYLLGRVAFESGEYTKAAELFKEALGPGAQHSQDYQLAIGAENELVADERGRAAVAMGGGVREFGLAPEDFAGEVERGGAHVAEMNVEAAIGDNGGRAGRGVFPVHGSHAAGIRLQDLGIPDDLAVFRIQAEDVERDLGLRFAFRAGKVNAPVREDGR